MSDSLPPASSSTSPNRLQWSARTDRGRIRPNNEDAFLGLRFDAREVQRLGGFGEATTEQHDYVFAVSDGMGGANAGEFASRLAVEQITALLPRSFHQQAAGMNPGYPDVLGDLFAKIHRAIKYWGGSYEECANMGATLSLCWFTPGWMYFGHIGDSRIYYLPAGAGALRQLSHDDTHVGWLFRNGKINEREARTHPRRNVLQKALGGGNQFVDPQVGAVGYEPGDCFLLCTDGLIGGLFDSQIEESLRQGIPEAASLTRATRLVADAVTADGRDNTTALIVQIA
ncbi:MAG: serine/threonine-protein phosphatase [Verrucomicrobiae bacterium]|nr:serine/threonine-protein phosphatase [Verrucomicrobiae bacterium]